MAGELQGFIDCAECKANSPVRLNKNKKLFYVCPSCGLIYPNMKEGQDKIKSRMRPVNEPESAKEKQVSPIAEEKETAAPKTTQPPVMDAPPPKPKKSGIWGMMP